MTDDEVRKAFVYRMQALVEHWSGTDAGDLTVAQRVHGAVFSVLAIIDGVPGDAGEEDPLRLALRPLIEENGAEVEGDDIAGRLSDMLGPFPGG